MAASESIIKHSLLLSRIVSREIREHSNCTRGPDGFIDPESCYVPFWYTRVSCCPSSVTQSLLESLWGDYYLCLSVCLLTQSLTSDGRYRQMVSLPRPKHLLWALPHTRLPARQKADNQGSTAHGLSQGKHFNYHFLVYPVFPIPLFLYDILIPPPLISVPGQYQKEKGLTIPKSGSSPARTSPG